MKLVQKKDLEMVAGFPPESHLKTFVRSSSPSLELLDLIRREAGANQAYFEILGRNLPKLDGAVLFELDLERKVHLKSNVYRCCRFLALPASKPVLQKARQTLPDLVQKRMNLDLQGPAIILGLISDLLLQARGFPPGEWIKDMILSALIKLECISELEYDQTRRNLELSQTGFVLARHPHRFTVNLKQDGALPFSLSLESSRQAA